MDKENPFNTYFKKISILSIVLFAAIWLAGATLFQNYFSLAFPFVVLFFASVSMLAHKSILKISQLKSNQFVNYYLGINAIKLLVYLFFILIYLFIFRSDAIYFVFWCIFLYFIFLIFDTISVMQYFKGFSNKNLGNKND
jgi:hypothetical protein